MPLPSVAHHGALQCRAKAKHSALRCLNPAAFGMPVCRFHGARRPETIRRGKNHPQYRHGLETRLARADHRGFSVKLRHLEDLMFLLRMMNGKKTPGRKPSS